MSSSSSLLGECGEGCGWIAACITVLVWGSYGVPLKLPQQQTNSKIEVNFFVLQTYKTMVCFITCWFVILLGEPIRFTSWGILSGIFWVPGAACGIYGIRTAGLAVAVGTWSSIIVVTSFCFGIILFQEQVKNVYETIFAFIILISGLIGMSRYSDPNFTTTIVKEEDEYEEEEEENNDNQNVTYDDYDEDIDNETDRHHDDDDETEQLLYSHHEDSATTPGENHHRTLSTGTISATASVSSTTGSGSIHDGTSTPVVKRKTTKSKTKKSFQKSESIGDTIPSSPPRHLQFKTTTTTKKSKMSPFEIEAPPSTAPLPIMPLLSNTKEKEKVDDNDHKSRSRRRRGHGTVGTDHKNDRIILLGGKLILTKRQLGILGAVINGAWGGMNLIPLHYAQRDLQLSGATYLISYATGSMIVCISMWIILILYYYITSLLLQLQHVQPQSSSISISFSSLMTTIMTIEYHKVAILYTQNALPKFHVKQLGVPGLLAGLLYSIGNFGSIIAVTYLGQGIGFSFCQGQLLISGLWGVFYFHEITNTTIIFKWFVSAIITIIGIIWLSYEHVGESSVGH